MDAPLWQPSPEAIQRSQLGRFAREVEARFGARCADYAALHSWSLREPTQFWRSVWEFCEVIGEGPGEVVLRERGPLPAVDWFPAARLNFAENLLAPGADSELALVEADESGARRRWTRGELRAAVARFAGTLERWGIGPGDRVAGVLPNRAEAIVAMLASARIGAIWSSCSPDFGVRGVLDRFAQIGPRVLIGAAQHDYAGKRFDDRAKLAEIAAGLPTLEHVVVVGAADTPAWIGWDEALSGEPSANPCPRFPFAQPLYILYSSGTTGVPKCIVHGAGGTLLQHLKEQRLHCDLRAGEPFFYYTTCGWMMWNWLVSGLASRAPLVLFDGSPFHPAPDVLFDLVDAERIAVFGVSAKYLEACAKAGLRPLASHSLASLRLLLSTGSPLLPEQFDYVYREIKSELHLASISGGTDIVSCFVGGAPTLPVRRGEIQAAGLGMAVEVFDPQGRPLARGKGELVCTQPFPSMPLGFWNDADGVRYRAAYFERFPGVWHHGDFAERTEHGGFVIHGRSDAVLNVGGVRIGTAEIYRPLDAIDEVIEGLAIEQEGAEGPRCVLFVRLREGARLDATLESRIRAQIRREASPRHVPAVIAAVADLPRTRSGKIAELAVRAIVHGRPVENREALANPEALELFRDLPALAR